MIALEVYAESPRLDLYVPPYVPEDTSVGLDVLVANPYGGNVAWIVGSSSTGLGLRMTLSLSEGSLGASYMQVCYTGTLVH